MKVITSQAVEQRSSAQTFTLEVDFVALGAGHHEQLAKQIKDDADFKEVYTDIARSFLSSSRDPNDPADATGYADGFALTDEEPSPKPTLAVVVHCIDGPSIMYKTQFHYPFAVGTFSVQHDDYITMDRPFVRDIADDIAEALEDAVDDLRRALEDMDITGEYNVLVVSKYKGEYRGELLVPAGSEVKDMDIKEELRRHQKMLYEGQKHAVSKLVQRFIKNAMVDQEIQQQATDILKDYLESHFFSAVVGVHTDREAASAARELLPEVRQWVPLIFNHDQLMMHDLAEVLRKLHLLA